MWNICGKLVAFAACAAILCLTFLGCSREPTPLKQGELAPLEFSKNLRLVDLQGESVAEIQSMVGRDTLLRRFVLREESQMKNPLPKELEGAVLLQVPLKRLVVLSSAQIGYLLRLGKENNIVGVGDGKYIADSALFTKVAAGEVSVVGSGPTLSLEKLLALKSDLVMSFATGGGQDDYDRINALGLPLMLTSEWQENSPLAKAEWIKLYGKLLEGPSAKTSADSIFEQIKNDYRSAQLPFMVNSDSAGICQGPKVIAGMSYGGIWHAPGGASYTAKLIEDAGGCYLWGADSSRELNFTLEEIMLVADRADVWVNPGMFSTPQEILAAEPRAAYLRAFKEKRVCQNDGVKGLGGGNDFFEGAVARPAQLLKNLQDCLWNRAKSMDSLGSSFDWYHNIFIF